MVMFLQYPLAEGVPMKRWPATVVVSALATLPAGSALAQEAQVEVQAPAPPEAEGAPYAAAPQAGVAAQGEWVYTDQYGWVWVPAGSSTTLVGEDPYAYLYTPAYGWAWFASPWGVGPFYRGGWGWGPRWGYAYAPHAWGYGWGSHYGGHYYAPRVYSGGHYFAPHGVGGAAHYAGGSHYSGGAHYGGYGGAHYSHAPSGGHFSGGSHFSGGGGHFGGGGHGGGGHGGGHR